jgi:putative SOS response-associated peptidase YedK
MLDRFSRARQGMDYVAPLLPGAEFDKEIFRQSWNIAAASSQPVINAQGARLEVWGYRPRWAIARKAPLTVSLRADKCNEPPWRGMWKSKRIIVPADGWYEWALESGCRRPYFVRPISGEPLFLAGISSAAPDGKRTEGDGFVIITSASEGGLLDPYLRTPLVLDIDQARQWLDAGTTLDEARQLAARVSIAADRYEWFPVSLGVNSIRNDERAFSEPITEWG